MGICKCKGRDAIYHLSMVLALCRQKYPNKRLPMVGFPIVVFPISINYRFHWIKGISLATTKAAGWWRCYPHSGDTCHEMDTICIDHFSQVVLTHCVDIPLVKVTIHSAIGFHHFRRLHRFQVAFLLLFTSGLCWWNSYFMGPGMPGKTSHVTLPYKQASTLDTLLV
jgi:hypothetical protein